MSAAHTPGPWTFSRWNEFGDMRFYIAQADGAPHTPQLSDVATLIAETPSNEWQSIQEANARLIAAAPELLAAQTMGAELNTPRFLDWVADRLVDVYGESPNVDFVQSLRARATAGRSAIAKATGEQP